MGKLTQVIVLVINWVFAGFFLLIGLLSIIDAPLGGFCLIVISFLLLPPIRKFAYEKTKIEIPGKVRALIILVLFMGFGFFANQSQEQKAQKLAEQKAIEAQKTAAKEKARKIEYFNENKESILSSIKALINAGDYQTALSNSNKYLVAKDSDLIHLHKRAKQEIDNLNAKKEMERLILELENINSSDYGKRLSIYQKLVKLDPKNEEYKEKLYLYKVKDVEQKEKSRIAKTHKKKIEEQFSAWDGSHYGLEKVIKSSMNDPDSYEHVKTIYWDEKDYLVVKTTFRGTNLYGGKVVNWIKAKSDMNGNIIEVMESGP